MQATMFTHAEIEKLVMAAVAERAEIALDDPNFIIRVSLFVDADGRIGAAASIRQIVPALDPNAE